MGWVCSGAGGGFLGKAYASWRVGRLKRKYHSLAEQIDEYVLLTETSTPVGDAAVPEEPEGYAPVLDTPIARGIDRLRGLYPTLFAAGGMVAGEAVAGAALHFGPPDLPATNAILAGFLSGWIGVAAGYLLSRPGLQRRLASLREKHPGLRAAISTYMESKG